ncbi:MAG: DUF2809 domain-containing protein [Chloroflexota bacterium]
MESAAQPLRSHSRQFLYLLIILIGAVFVLVYRGPYWPFVRGYMGDWLIVQFIYVIARFWISFRRRYRLAIAIFVFSLFVELIQFFAAGSIPHTFAAEVTIGSTFDPGDIAAYALGLATVLLSERYWKPQGVDSN